MTRKTPARSAGSARDPSRSKSKTGSGSGKRPAPSRRTGAANARQTQAERAGSTAGKSAGTGATPAKATASTRTTAAKRTAAPLRSAAKAGTKAAGAKPGGSSREPKTTRTRASVEDFLAAVPDARRRLDATTVDALLREVTGEAPAMWGTSIVGYGSYTQHYADGRSLEWPITGFSPRKAALVVYLMPGFENRQDLLSRLGRHDTGKVCLYIKRLADVDLDVLRELVAGSVTQMRQR